MGVKMKHLFLAISFILLAQFVYSQPNKISYQGVLTDDDGALITGTKNLVFRIYNVSSGGTELITDTHNDVSVSAGLFSVELNVGSIDFSQSLWLEITVESITLSPRVALNANGYALAGKATSLKIATNAGEGKVLTSDANGNASWQSAVGGLTNFTESNYTYDSKTGVKLSPNNATSNVDFVIQPKGSGAVIASQPDGATTGGINRGANAVDLQTIRNTNSHIASGTASVIMGGSSNTASGNYSTVSGIGLTASGLSSTAFGQGGNSIGNFSFGAGKDISVNGIGSVGLGYENTTMGNYTLATGIGNVAISDAEAVFGKYATTYTANNNSTDRILAVGNGTSTSDRSNALTILKNANTYIGGSLTINGNGTNASVTFPTSRGTNNQFLKTDGSGATSWDSHSSFSWSLTGNSGTSPVTHFIGTTDNNALIFKVNNNKAGEVSSGTNTAFGYYALNSNTSGSSNTAFGNNSLYNNTSGVRNVALGAKTMENNTTGNNTVAVGYSAGSQYQTCSNSVYLGADAQAMNDGNTNEIVIGYGAIGNGSNSITLGTDFSTESTYIHGIAGQNVPSGVSVYINASGKLGTVTSSARFKENIKDMNSDSDVLMKLRPVSFVYKDEYGNGDKSIQYGLIAEEVAALAPNLVAFDKDDKPYTVYYHRVNAMLLNEVQKQYKIITNQESSITLQSKLIEKQANTIIELQKEISKLKDAMADYQNMNNNLLEKFSKLSDKFNEIIINQTSDKAEK